MKTMHLTAAVAAVLLAGLPAVTQEPAKEPAVTLKTVKYDDLSAAVMQHKGKVVVVDLWSVT
jgi:hypothetical protein